MKLLKKAFVAITSVSPTMKLEIRKWPTWPAACAPVSSLAKKLLKSGIF